MRSQFMAWIGAAVLAAGLTTATLAGIGVAAAQDGTGDGGTTSPSTNSTGTEGNSDTGTIGANDKTDPGVADEGMGPADTAGPKVESKVDPETIDDEDVVDESDGNEDEIVGDEAEVDTTLPTDNQATVEKTEANANRVAREAEQSVAENPVVENPVAENPAVKDTGPEEPVVEKAVHTVEEEPALVIDEPQTRRLALDIVPDTADDAAVYALAAPLQAQEQATGPTLLNIIGTLVWSVFDLVTKLVDLPPAVPLGSSLAAGRSTLEIDCGDGYTADADWYYPKDGQPDKFIYFQHGFLARAGFYNVTLQELAERNNAIVVAPSITSNYFACDGCSVTADPMHNAVARLFEGDRAALLVSARAAGFEGTLPPKFVLAGQSAGTMLAAGTSGYYYEKAQAEGRESDLVGVLLFDASAANGALGRALDKLAPRVPVLNIAAEPAVFNYYGAANELLSAKRSGQFNGVQLINGAHSDGFQSSAYFGVVQAVVALGFGASAPQNVEAVQVLSEGWITDMYADRVYNPVTRTGIYGVPGQPGAVVVDILTDAGLARGYVLPAPTYTLSPFEQFYAAVVHAINSNDYVTCSTGSSATAAALC